MVPVDLQGCHVLKDILNILLKFCAGQQMVDKILVLTFHINSIVKRRVKKLDLMIEFDILGETVDLGLGTKTRMREKTAF